MRVGFYTSTHYFEPKKEAVLEAAARFGIEAQIGLNSSFAAMMSTEQTFGFEDLMKKTKGYAAQAVMGQDADIGIGVENALTFLYAANEWYYVICIALQMRDGTSTANFTSGISIPPWMVKEVQDNHLKLDVLTQRLAGEDDPVIYFSQHALTRKDLMVPAILLGFSKLGLGKGEESNKIPHAPAAK